MENSCVGSTELRNKLEEYWKGQLKGALANNGVNRGLWGFLAAWRALFDRFDEDRSGSISYDEYSKALVTFGYHLSANFVTTLYRLYDRPGPNAMSFDLFVQSCISLKRMTDVFKKYDDDRDGYVTLSFEQFLTGESILVVELEGRRLTKKQRS